MLFVAEFRDGEWQILCLDGAQVDKNIEYLEGLMDQRPDYIFFEAELVML